MTRTPGAILAELIKATEARQPTEAKEEELKTSTEQVSKDQGLTDINFTITKYEP